MPARPDSLQLARLTAAYAAARADLLYDDVQDLRLAIDELCMSLLGPEGTVGGEARLSISYRWDDHCVEVLCSVDDAGGVDADGWAHLHAAAEQFIDGDGAPGVDALLGGNAVVGGLGVDGGFDGGGGSAPWARQILDALVDDHGVSYGPGRRLGWLRKHRVGAANP